MTQNSISGENVLRQELEKTTQENRILKNKIEKLLQENSQMKKALYELNFMFNQLKQVTATMTTLPTTISQPTPQSQSSFQFITSSRNAESSVPSSPHHNKNAYFDIDRIYNTTQNHSHSTANIPSNSPNNNTIPANHNLTNLNATENHSTSINNNNSNNNYKQSKNQNSNNNMSHSDKKVMTNSNCINDNVIPGSSNIDSTIIDNTDQVKAISEKVGEYQKTTAIDTNDMNTSLANVNTQVATSLADPYKNAINSKSKISSAASHSLNPAPTTSSATNSSDPNTYSLSPDTSPSSFPSINSPIAQQGHTFSQTYDGKIYNANTTQNSNYNHFNNDEITASEVSSSSGYSNIIQNSQVSDTLSMSNDARRLSPFPSPRNEGQIENPLNNNFSKSHGGDGFGSNSSSGSGSNNGESVLRSSMEQTSDNIDYQAKMDKSMFSRANAVGHQYHQEQQYHQYPQYHHYYDPMGVSGSSMISNGSNIASSTINSKVSPFQYKYEFNGHKGAVYSVKFSPCGQYIASCSFDKTVKLWDARQQSLIHTLRGHQSSVFDICWSNDGGRNIESKYMASGGADRYAKLWDITTGKLLKSLKTEGYSQCVQLTTSSATGSVDLLFATDTRKNIYIFDPRLNNNHSNSAGSAGAGSAGSGAGAGGGGNANIVGSSSLSAQEQNHPTSSKAVIHIQNDCMANALYVYRAGYHVLTGDQRGYLKIWDYRKSPYLIDARLNSSNTEITTPLTASGNQSDNNSGTTGLPISWLSVSKEEEKEEGRFLAVNSYDNILRMYDRGTILNNSLKHFNLLQEFKGHKNCNWPIKSSFSPVIQGTQRDHVMSQHGEKSMETGSDHDGDENDQTGVLKESLMGHEDGGSGSGGAGGAGGALGSRKRQNEHYSFEKEMYLATGSSDGCVYVFNTSHKDIIQKIECHSDIVYGVDFHPFDLILATCSGDNRITVYKARDL